LEKVIFSRKTAIVAVGRKKGLSPSDPLQSSISVRLEGGGGGRGFCGKRPHFLVGKKEGIVRKRGNG